LGEPSAATAGQLFFTQPRHRDYDIGARFVRDPQNAGTYGLISFDLPPADEGQQPAPQTCGTLVMSIDGFLCSAATIEPFLKQLAAKVSFATTRRPATRRFHNWVIGSTRNPQAPGSVLTSSRVLSREPANSQ
jgi:hypothetical protein